MNKHVLCSLNWLQTSENCRITSRNTSCWVCPLNFDVRREMLSLSVKTVVAHKTVKPLMMEKFVERKASSSRSVCKISGETARILSECMRVVWVNNTVTYFNLFVCPFKQHDMSVMTRVSNFTLYAQFMTRYLNENYREGAFRSLLFTL